jgi:hypothetical protein
LTRDLTQAVAAATRLDHVFFTYACALDFDSGMVRATALSHSIWFDGDGDGSDEEFLGVGAFGGISTVEEGVELKDYRLQLRLSALTLENVAIALNENYRNRPAWIWKVYFDADHRVIADPELIFSGRMDAMAVSVGSRNEILLTVVSRMAQWERPKVARYTDAEQRRRFPGDRGLEFISQMEELQLYWGPQ